MSNYEDDYRKVKISFGKLAKTYHAWHADIEKVEHEELVIGNKYNCVYNGKEYKITFHGIIVEGKNLQLDVYASHLFLFVITVYVYASLFFRIYNEGRDSITSTVFTSFVRLFKMSYVMKKNLTIQYEV